MAWLKVDQDLRDHRKLLEAADILDMEPVHLMGHLISLWLWSLSNVPDGNIGNLTKKTIARAAQWKDDPDELIDALVEKCLLDKTEDGLFIHDWDDYAGALIRKQEEDRQRARKNREKKKEFLDDTRSVREPFADELETSVVREEKNRREKIITEKNTRESNGGAPSCDEDISLNVPVNENENENVNEERKTRTSANGAQVSDGFYRFWEAYPRKINKKQALDEWNKIRPDAELADAIITGVERWKQSKQWTDDDGQYIPYPDSFLSKERWKDEVRPETKKVPVMKNYDDDEDFLGKGGASP